MTEADHSALAQLERGTPVGDLLRNYWVPALLSEELPTSGGAPIRLQLLGEPLVAFRTDSGEPGLLSEYCRHRGASLFLARNEPGGLRCSYHGWKFDRRGACIEAPNAPWLAGTDVVRQPAYPCREAGSVLWAYLGEAQNPPPLPELGWLKVPDEQRFVAKRLQECNWLQALEVDIDSSHVPWLHREEFLDGTLDRKGQLFLEQTAPDFEIVDRQYGLMIGARRDAGAGANYWRVNHWLMPWYTLVPSEDPDEVLGVHAWVPIDPWTSWVYGFSWHPHRPLTEQERSSYTAGLGGIYLELLPNSYRPRRNPSNLWEIDREAQRRGRPWVGITGNQEQDNAITESMGPLYDRTQERLVPADAAVLAVRRDLLQQAQQAGEGKMPKGRNGAGYDAIPVSVELPGGGNWAAEAERIGQARLATQRAGAIS